MPIDLHTRNALMDLHARYAFTIDQGEAEAWAACFTPDGVMETTRPIVVSGRAALVQFAADRASALLHPARHVTWHQTFEEGGWSDEVGGRCAAAILETTAQGVRVIFTATYVDAFARVGGEWLLRHRRVLIDRVPD